MTSDRQNLALIRSEYQGANVVITPGYLRLEQSLQQGALTGVDFSILENQGAANCTEVRLRLPDSFHITKIFFGLIKAGTTVAATQPEIAVAKVRTFNNPLVFTGANEAVNLNNFYNGNYKIQVDQTVYMDRDELRKFYRVPTSQKGVGPAQVIIDDEYSNPDYGFYPLEPTVRLSGATSNKITLTFPQSISMVGTATQNFAVCICRGYYVQGGAKFRSKSMQ